MLRKLIGMGVVLVMLAAGLAACGGDDDQAQVTPTAQQDVEPAAGPDLSGPGPALGSGPVPGVAAGTVMPGCSDPDDEECPMPLLMDLDATAAADGVSVDYPDRYFVAQVGDQAPEGALIALMPSENNVYEQTAVFQVYFAASFDEALEVLGDEAEIVDWPTESLGTGKIGVQRDETQDPPANLTIGAFQSGERVVVLRLDTTGKYGWDLWSQLYNSMLNTLTVAD